MTSKISFLVNLDKTNMNPLHTYTIYLSWLLTYPICSYLQTVHFLCWGLISALNAADFVGLSNVKNLLLGYCVEHCW